jgi:hypothetical protein
MAYQVLYGALRRRLIEAEHAEAQKAYTRCCPHQALIVRNPTKVHRVT